METDKQRKIKGLGLQVSFFFSVYAYYLENGDEWQKVDQRLDSKQQRETELKNVSNDIVGCRPFRFCF